MNTGVVAWPDEDSAWSTVRRMQLKLHRWASEDSARRFGDLFNLVYDPAFLIHAWERVRSNDGARTAGVDGLTVAQIETRVGVHAFLGQVRDLLKSGEYRPSPVRRVKIPKGGGKPGVESMRLWARQADIDVGNAGTLIRLLAGIGRRIGIAGLRTGVIIAGSSHAGSPQKQKSKCDAGNGIKSHDHAILLGSQA